MERAAGTQPPPGTKVNSVTPTATSRTRLWLVSGWGQPYLPHQFGKPRVRTQGIEQEVRLQELQTRIALMIGRIKPLEGLILLSQVSVECSNLVCRRVASLALFFAHFNGFGQSALPDSR